MKTISGHQKKHTTAGRICAERLCRHSRDDHRDGTGVVTDCRKCACTAYVSRTRMIGRRLFWALLTPQGPTSWFTP